MLKPWVPKTERAYVHDVWTERLDYWSRPYPATQAMQEAIKRGLERELPSK